LGPPFIPDYKVEGMLLRDRQPYHPAVVDGCATYFDVVQRFPELIDMVVGGMWLRSMKKKCSQEAQAALDKLHHAAKRRHPSSFLDGCARVQDVIDKHKQLLQGQ
jgi:hypothetical protein